VEQHLPFAEPTSNNAIPLAHSLTAFLLSVVVGAQRFAHCEWLRADHVLHTACWAWSVFPVMTRSATFSFAFPKGTSEAFWRPLWRWLLRLVKCPAGGFALDLDSTVFCREGKQEGARKGFNPRRKGRKQPSSAAGGAWRRRSLFCTAGCAAATRARRAEFVPFLQEALNAVTGGDVAAHGAGRQRLL